MSNQGKRPLVTSYNPLIENISETESTSTKLINGHRSPWIHQRGCLGKHWQCSILLIFFWIFGQIDWIPLKSWSIHSSDAKTMDLVLYNWESWMGRSFQASHDCFDWLSGYGYQNILGFLWHMWIENNGDLPWSHHHHCQDLHLTWLEWTSTFLQRLFTDILTSIILVSRHIVIQQRYGYSSVP